MEEILIVEDDPAIRSLMCRVLAAKSYAVTEVGTAATALREISRREISLVLLDLGLPDLDGTVALRMIRSVSDVPVIVVTGRTDESSVVEVLDDGADDYVAKPFSSDLLIARVRALLRRTKGTLRNRTVIQVGDLRLDKRHRTAWLADEELELVRHEFDLLALLADNSGRVVPRSVILERVWGYPARRGNDQTVNVHMALLRSKLGENRAAPRYLHTIRGIGFKLIRPS